MGYELLRFEHYDYKNNEWTHFYDPSDLPEEKESVYYGDIHSDSNGNFIIFPLTSYSDYGGGTAERSNCRTFWEMFKDKKVNEKTSVWLLYGGYGSRGILIRKELLEDEEIKELLEDLEDYPLIDDEDLSRLKWEIFEEDWDCWIKSDLKHELDKKEITYAEDEEILWDQFLFVMNELNIYPECEDAVSVWIPIEKIVDGWDLINKMEK